MINPTDEHFIEDLPHDMLMEYLKWKAVEDQKEEEQEVK